MITMYSFGCILLEFLWSFMDIHGNFVDNDKYHYVIYSMTKKAPIYLCIFEL